MPKEGIDKIFATREDFAILGVTGRTGSGCSTLSRLLTNKIENINFPSPEQDLDSNNKRRYKITYNYIQKNWKPFYWIKVKDIITSFILDHDLNDILIYLKEHFESKKDIVVPKEIGEKFYLLKQKNEDIEQTILKLEHSIDIEITEVVKYYDFYFKSITQLTEDLKTIFNVSNVSNLNYSSVYQLFGDNIRSSGSIIDSNYNPEKIYSISA